MKNYFLSIVLLTLIVLCSFAQTEKQKDKRFSVHLGTSIPISDFGSDNLGDEGIGAAAVGLNVGFQYRYPLSETGLSILGGIDFNYNGLQKNIKDGDSDDIKYFKYINVPITAGLNYTFQVYDKMAVFTNAKLALNFLKITNFEVKYAGDELISKFDLANNFGLKIGGGLLINQKISVSIDYLRLGAYDINVTTTYKHPNPDLNNESDRFKVKVDMLTLTLGFRF